MRIQEVGCIYFGNGEYYGFEVTTDNPSDNYEWYCDDGAFYTPVLDFLNQQYHNLAGGGVLNAWMTFNNRMNETLRKIHGGDALSQFTNSDEYVRLVMDDLAPLEKTHIREIADMVLLATPSLSGLSCAQRWAAYSIPNPREHTLSFRSKISIEYDVIEKAQKNTGGETLLGDNLASKLRELRKQNAGYTFTDVCRLIRKNDYPIGLIAHHIFDTLRDMILFLLSEMIRLNVSIKKCANCGKYFVPARSDAIFCGGISLQDKGKTCQEYGKYANYLKKTQTDEATRLYRQIYNSKNNKARRCKTDEYPKGNPVLNNDLEQFASMAANYRQEVKTGTKTEAEYIEWLKATKGKEAHDGKH